MERVRASKCSRGERFKEWQCASLTPSTSLLNGANSAKSLIHWCSSSLHDISFSLTLSLSSIAVEWTLIFGCFPNWTELPERTNQTILLCFPYLSSSRITSFSLGSHLKGRSGQTILFFTSLFCLPLCKINIFQHRVSIVFHVRTKTIFFFLTVLLHTCHSPSLAFRKWNQHSDVDHTARYRARVRTLQCILRPVSMVICFA